MPLKLACADFAFPLLSHDKVLDLIALLEFDAVDIGLFEGRSHLWPSKEFPHPTRSGERLGRELAHRSLRCADVFLQMNPNFVPYAINHPQSARRRRAHDWFLRTPAFAAASGAKHVPTLPGVLFGQATPSPSWRSRRADLAWRAAKERRQTPGSCAGTPS